MAMSTEVFPNDEPTDAQRAALARQAHIAALRREHEGYVRYGHQERAAEVETELKRMGALTTAAEATPRRTAVPEGKSNGRNVAG